MGITRDVILLAILEHRLVKGRSDTWRNDHTHGQHDAHPRGQQLIGHALVGIHGDKRIEQHHASGAYDDGPFHALQQTRRLHLKVHKQRGGCYQHEAQGEEPLEMDALVVEQKDDDQADEIAQQHPVAEGGHLDLVGLHAHPHKDVDEHGAGVAHHQADEEQYAALNATRLKGLEHEVRRAARLLQVEEQQRRHHTNGCGPTDIGTVVPIVDLAVDRYIDKRAAHHAEHHHVAKLGERQGAMLRGVGIVGHAHQGDEQSHEDGAQHGVVDHLPMVVVGKPCGDPCADLP